MQLPPHSPRFPRPTALLKGSLCFYRLDQGNAAPPSPPRSNPDPPEPCVVLQIQDGPLAGIEAMQSTIGEYTVDDEEPTKQKVR